MHTACDSAYFVRAAAIRHEKYAVWDEGSEGHILERWVGSHKVTKSHRNHTYLWGTDAVSASPSQTRQPWSGPVMPTWLATGIFLILPALILDLCWHTLALRTDRGSYCVAHCSLWTPECRRISSWLRKSVFLQGTERRIMFVAGGDRRSAHVFLNRSIVKSDWALVWLTDCSHFPVRYVEWTKDFVYKRKPSFSFAWNTSRLYTVYII